MKANELFYLMENIDDGFIYEASAMQRKSRKPFIIKVAAIAACFAMALSVILFHNAGDAEKGAYAIEGGVCIPPNTISVKNGTECDIIRVVKVGFCPIVRFQNEKRKENCCVTFF